MSSLRFAENVAVITGVSDRGIGSAIVDQFAAEGASIVIWGCECPDRVLKRLKRKGVPHQFTQCDLREPRQIEAARDRLLDQFGKIDVLVNNAGVEQNVPVEEMTDADWELQLDVNLTGAMRVTRACLPHLSRPGGVVVNVASVLGLAGGAGYAAYSASKAGLIGFTQSMAVELAAHQQRAVCVAPALVLTPMTHKHMEQLEPETSARILGQHPLGIGMPNDVSEAICFLASEQARWITGIALPLGWHPQFGVSPQQVALSVQQQAGQSVTGEPLVSPAVEAVNGFAD